MTPTGFVTLRLAADLRATADRETVNALKQAVDDAWTRRGRSVSRADIMIALVEILASYLLDTPDDGMPEWGCAAVISLLSAAVAAKARDGGKLQ